MKPENKENIATPFCYWLKFNQRSINLLREKLHDEGLIPEAICYPSADRSIVRSHLQLLSVFITESMLKTGQRPINNSLFITDGTQGETFIGFTCTDREDFLKVVDKAIKNANSVIKGLESDKLFPSRE